MRLQSLGATPPVSAGGSPPHEQHPSPRTQKSRQAPRAPLPIPNPTGNSNDEARRPRSRPAPPPGKPPAPPGVRPPPAAGPSAEAVSAPPPQEPEPQPTMQPQPPQMTAADQHYQQIFRQDPQHVSFHDSAMYLQHGASLPDYSAPSSQPPLEEVGDGGVLDTYMNAFRAGFGATDTIGSLGAPTGSTEGPGSSFGMSASPSRNDVGPSIVDLYSNKGLDSYIANISAGFGGNTGSTSQSPYKL